MRRTGRAVAAEVARVVAQAANQVRGVAAARSCIRAGFGPRGLPVADHGGGELCTPRSDTGLPASWACAGPQRLGIGTGGRGAVEVAVEGVVPQAAARPTHWPRGAARGGDTGPAAIAPAAPRVAAGGRMVAPEVVPADEHVAGFAVRARAFSSAAGCGRC